MVHFLRLRLRALKDRMMMVSEEMHVIVIDGVRNRSSGYQDLEMTMPTYLKTSRRYLRSEKMWMYSKVDSWQGERFVVDCPYLVGW